jgi:putative drug exporter of the RND superfamily
MFAGIGRFVTRLPWLVITTWILLATAAILTSPGLGGVTNSDQSAFLPDNAESTRAARLAERVLPANAGVTSVLVVARRDGAELSDSDVTAVGQLAEQLTAGRRPITRSIFFDAAQTVSPNHKVAMLVAQFDGVAERSDVQSAVKAMRAQVSRLLADTSLTAGMTGQAAIVVDNQQAFGNAELIVTVATAALIITLLLLIFRSPIAALLPLLAVGLVFGVSVSLVATIAQALDFKVGQELPTMLTVVLFGIGTDYILFLLFRYRERLRAGDAPRDAIVAAVARVGEAICSAAFAVIAAFGALVLAALGFFKTLGPALAIGVAVMLLAALTLVPAIVALLGRAVFWPSRLTRSTEARHLARGTRFVAVGRVVARRPVAVIVASVLVLGALGAAAVRFQPVYDPIAQLPPNTEATRAYQDLKRGFPAGALNPTTVYLSADEPIEPAAVQDFVTRIARVEGVAATMPPQSAPDGKTVAVSLVLSVEPYGTAGLDLVSGPLRKAARAAAPSGSTVLVGGQSMAFADVRSATNHDLTVIFPVAGLLFLLILAGLLRAIVAPLYLVAMVVLGFVATLGATALVFQDGFGADGLGFIIPIILYLFVTAIGTDYNILMTARLREELEAGHDRRRAAALAVEHAGPSIAAAALILAGTFGALLVSGVPFFAQIGFAVTVGIVLVAFVVSMLLVPAMTALTGPRPRPAVPSLDDNPSMDITVETAPALSAQ